jgi:hypothetical protein
MSGIDEIYEIVKLAWGRVYYRIMGSEAGRYASVEGASLDGPCRVLCIPENRVFLVAGVAQGPFPNLMKPEISISPGQCGVKHLAIAQRSRLLRATGGPRPPEHHLSELCQQGFGVESTTHVPRMLDTRGLFHTFS